MADPRPYPRQPTIAGSMQHFILIIIISMYPTSTRYLKPSRFLSYFYFPISLRLTTPPAQQYPFLFIFPCLLFYCVKNRVHQERRTFEVISKQITTQTLSIGGKSSCSPSLVRPFLKLCTILAKIRKLGNCRLWSLPSILTNNFPRSFHSASASKPLEVRSLLFLQICLSSNTLR